MMPRSHIVKLQRELRETVNGEWQTVIDITGRLRRADDSIVRRGLDVIVAAGEIQREIRKSKHGRMARHYRRAT